MNRKSLPQVLSSLIIIVFVCWSTKAFCCNRVVLKQSIDLQKQLGRENVTYVVKYVFDLKGGKVTLPHGSLLSFQGGGFRNGTVVGNETSISANKNRVFERIVLSGSWINQIVYSEWLDFIEGTKQDNSLNFRNLMLLCTGDRMTHLYMQEGVFSCSVIKESSNIQVPSNLYWHNLATINQLPTDLPKYSLVMIMNSSNVTIDGGEFVGDVLTHTGIDGEWGHGITIAGSTNIVLKNLIARNFWGDGIDLVEREYVSSISAGVGPCQDVVIDNVKCLFNRRQGMSIEAAKNVIVKNSEFAFTGKYKMTSPGAGVDIEPWCTNEIKIESIFFDNCFVHDNNPTKDFCLEPTIQYHVSAKKVLGIPSSKIEIHNCRLGRLYVYGAHTAKIVNCQIDEITRFEFGKNITMDNCIIKNKTDIKPRPGLTLIKCK